jgi:predicted nucleotidyltransferase
MNPVAKLNRSALNDVCRRYDVERLDVFGSATRPDFDPKLREVDLIVRFRAPDAPGTAERYYGLADALESLLGAPIGLVSEQSLRNPQLLQRIAGERVILFQD